MQRARLDGRLEARVQLVVERARALHRRDVLRDAREVDGPIVRNVERARQVRGEVARAVEAEHGHDPAGEQRLHDLALLVRRGSPRTGAREPGLLAQDLRLELPELRARLDAELLDEARPGSPGTRRAPPPAGPSGRAPASAGAEGLAQRMLARRAPRARRRRRRAARARGRLRSAPRARRAVAPRAAGSPACANCSNANSASAGPRQSASARSSSSRRSSAATPRASRSCCSKRCASTCSARDAEDVAGRRVSRTSGPSSFRSREIAVLERRRRGPRRVLAPEQIDQALGRHDPARPRAGATARSARWRCPPSATGPSRPRPRAARGSGTRASRRP